MVMPGRNWVSDAYRYGHNGQEKEDEIAKGINSAEYWMYDSRLGRRWETDPVVKPWESPYACFRGNPIAYADPRGLDGVPTGDKTSNPNNTPGGPKNGETCSNPDGTFETRVNGEWQLTDLGKGLNLSAITVSPMGIDRANFESMPTAKIPTGIGGLPVIKYEISEAKGLTELLYRSLTQAAIVELKGDLLNKIKVDKDMLNKQSEIISRTRSDSRYGKEDFYLTGTVYPTLGGIGGPGDSWWSYAPKAATNTLTWAVRHADVKYWVTVSQSGTMNIEFRLSDRLDLSPNGSGAAYDVISAVLGFGWHYTLGGNKNMLTQGIWNVEIAPNPPTSVPISIPTYSGK